MGKRLLTLDGLKFVLNTCQVSSDKRVLEVLEGVRGCYERVSYRGDGLQTADLLVIEQQVKEPSLSLSTSLCLSLCHIHPPSLLFSVCLALSLSGSVYLSPSPSLSLLHY